MTWSGTLTAIHIAPRGAAPMQALDAARLIEGIGIDGDRYATATGTYSHKPAPDRQVTLIETETLDALLRDHNLTLTADEHRRNLTTLGVPLNHLVGKTFRVGDTLLLGGRLNVPCLFLEDLLHKPVFKPLLNRSGLNCLILKGGTIRLGDSIRPE